MEIIMIQSVLWKDRKRTIFGLPLSFTKYSVTDEILYISKGFFNTTEDEVRLYRIMDLSLNRTLGQKLFGVGTIHCCSADKTLKDFDIVNIKKSKEIKALLSDLIEKQRESKRVISRENMLDANGLDDDDESTSNGDIGLDDNDSPFDGTDD